MRGRCRVEGKGDLSVAKEIPQSKRKLLKTHAISAYSRILYTICKLYFAITNADSQIAPTN